MSDDRYTARFKLIAAYLNTALASSAYNYYVPQAPTVSVSRPTGAHFAVLIQRGKIANDQDGGDTCFYGDRIPYHIFILVSDSIHDDQLMTYFNIAVDEIFTALRSPDVGDPPFGIANADEQTVEGSAPGQYGDATAEMITMSMRHEETY